MNLFKQAMYSKKIRSKEDTPKNTNNRDIMCSQGITGVKAGSLSHGQKWRQHKYLYKEGDRYIYPEDVASEAKKNYNDAYSKSYAESYQKTQDTMKKVGEGVNKVKSSVNKEKARLRSINRGSHMGDEKIRTSVLSNRKQEAEALRTYANDRKFESDKYDRGEYFDRSKEASLSKKEFNKDRSEAKNRAVAMDNMAKKAEYDYQRGKKDKENYEKASKLERSVARTFGEYENKKNAKKQKKWRKEHAAELEAVRKKKEAENKRYEEYLEQKKELKDALINPEKQKALADQTVKRTQDTVERMRKKKKRTQQ